MQKSAPPLSPAKILLIILLSIFLGETGLMLAFHFVEFGNSLAADLIDSIFLAILLIPILYHYAYKPLVQSNRELQRALDEIKTLKGVIPICSFCNKIRDDKEVWQQLEIYLTANSDAQFSHGLCPDCYEDQVAKIHVLKQERQKQAHNQRPLED
jgi:hypothetical protein